MLRARDGRGAELSLHLLFEGELLRATGPGLPDAGPATFYLARRQGTGRPLHRGCRVGTPLARGAWARGAMVT